MPLSKNLSQCRRCVNAVPIRQLNVGGHNALDSQKMQAKGVILSQWKLLSQLRDYLSKFTPDKGLLDSALNREFAKFLQKVQPSVYGGAQPQGGPGILGLMKRESEEPPKVLHWKKARPALTRESVTLTTCQILSRLAASQSDDSKLFCVEELISHVNRHPEARHTAVKDGAIRVLLKIVETANSEVKGAASEALATLGYASPVKGRGIRILSIDGGGVRGILVIEMLKKIEELTGKPVLDTFDLICGVSTGAIISNILGTKEVSLDEISEIYKNLSTQVFNQSALKGTSNLVWSQSYYDTALWEKLLKDKIGDQTLISTARNPKCPKLCALSAVVNQSRLNAYVFRNYTLPCRVQSQYMGSHKHLVWEAVRASAAAPTYFEEFKLGNLLHQDGGILFNNPTAVAIHEAKLLWPATPIQCVISFGTGRTVQPPLDHAPDQISVNSSSWKSKFYALIESATDTEGVHTMLSDLLPGDIYFRFNPYLTEMLEMSEIKPERLAQLERDAIMYLRRNEDKFKDAARVLSYEKTIGQKAADWLKFRGHAHGLKQLV